MKEKIKILIVILAYMLNLSHDLQPHVHCDDGYMGELGIFSVKHSHHDHDHSDHQHSHHNHDKDGEHRHANGEHDLPFCHDHVLQVHDNILFVNLMKFENEVRYVEQAYVFRLLKKPEVKQRSVVPRDDERSCRRGEQISVGLRAPPFMV